MASVTKSSATASAPDDAALGYSNGNAAADWQSPTNANSLDASYASITDNAWDATEKSDLLRWTGFGFSTSDIPAGSVIEGIVVVVTGFCTAGATMTITHAALHLSGTRQGTSKTPTVTFPSSNGALTGIGSSTDKWGWTAVTDSDIRDSGFGVEIGVTSGTNNADVSVDGVSVTVYYTTGIALSVTDTSTFSDTSTNLVKNSGFESFTAGLADNWTTYDDVYLTPTYADSTASPYGGSHCQKVAYTGSVEDSSGVCGVVSQPLQTASPGDVFIASCWMKDAAGDTASHNVGIQWLNASQVVISTSAPVCSVTTSWQRFSASATAPANTAYARLAVYASSIDPTTTVELYVDQAMLQRGNLLSDYVDTPVASVVEEWRGTLSLISSGDISLPTLSATVNVSDSPTLQVGDILKEVTDSATIADSAIIGLGPVVAAVTDTLTASDALPTTELLSDVVATPPADTVSLADSVAIIVGDILCSVTDTATATDTPEVGLGAVLCTASESLTASDTAYEATGDVLLAVQDDITLDDYEVSESPKLNVEGEGGGEGEPVPVSATDTLTLADNIPSGYTEQVILRDTATISVETPVGTDVDLPVVAENITLAESVDIALLTKTLVYENFRAANTLRRIHTGSDGCYTKVSQTFHAVGGLLDSVRWWGYKYGSPTGTVYCRLYTVSGMPGSTGLPDTLIATASADAATFVMDYDWSDSFVFDPPVALVHDQSYAITFEYDGGSHTARFEVYADAPSNGVLIDPAENMGEVPNNVGTWSAYEPGDLCVRIYELTVSKVVRIHDFVTAHDEATIGVGAVILATTDNIVASETVQVSGAHDIGVTDTASVTDSVAVVLGAVQVSVTDSVTLDDECGTPNVGTDTVNLPVVAENLRLSDTPSVTVGDLLKSVTDTVTANDTVALLVGDVRISVVDTVNVSETVAVSTGDIVVNVTDTFRIIDLELFHVGALLKDVSESVSLSDAAQIALGDIGISVSDTIRASDAPSIGLGAVRIWVLDYPFLLESLTLTLPTLVVGITETITVDDEATAVIAGAVTLQVSDSVTLADSAEIGVEPGATVERSATDNATVSDSIDLRVGHLLSPTDRVSLFDSVIVQLNPVVAIASESVTLLDSLSLRVGVYDVSPTDTVTLSDMASIRLRHTVSPRRWTALPDRVEPHDQTSQIAGDVDTRTQTQGSVDIHNQERG